MAVSVSNLSLIHISHIADDQRHRLRIEQLERLLATLSGNDGLPGKLERIAHRFAQIRVVFDDQYRQSRAHILQSTLVLVFIVALPSVDATGTQGSQSFMALCVPAYSCT